MKSKRCYRVSNVALPLDSFRWSDVDLLSYLAFRLGVKQEAIKEVELLRRSVDARRKSDVHFVGTFRIDLAANATPNAKKPIKVEPFSPTPELNPASWSLTLGKADPRPVVVGTGPAGLFAAWYLASAGLNPLVIEQGEPLDRRRKTVERFQSGGALNPYCNIQFGEGGAGTFSDGKLTTGIKDVYLRDVLRLFVRCGAPEEILWQAAPHIGTDRLVGVLKGLRGLIEDAGGEFLFNTKLVDITFEGGCVSGIVTAPIEEGVIQSSRDKREVKQLVLACGHSARDVFLLLRDKTIPLEPKAFSVGVRIEHPQAFINEVCYGAAASHPALGAAPYKLAVHTKRGRGVYSFCMCPGGEVVAAASEAGGVCVNGMSRFARDGENANSALLVSVYPQDFGDDDVLAGVAFQRALEAKAYEVARAKSGLPYTAPVSTLKDFLHHDAGTPSCWVKPSYPRTIAWCDLRTILPDFVCEAYEEAFPLLDAKLKGFAHPEAVLTGVESRSSSPLRIMRHDDYQAHLEKEIPSGLYPCGEGAGYAGGIMSSAVDGLRVAEALVRSQAQLMA